MPDCVFSAAVDQRDGVAMKTSASQSVDLEFISQVESYQKTLKNGIRSFLPWPSAKKGYCGKPAGKLAGCILATTLNEKPPFLRGRKVVGPSILPSWWPKPY